MTMMAVAQGFFEACETGKGWEGCKDFCTADAGFSAQADALAEIATLEGYAGWMKDLLVPIPDGRYELTSFAIDEERGTAVAAAVFHGTYTVAAGDLATTGNSVAADYVYVMSFEHGKIAHVTKIWNDLHSLKQLGWA
ncbi:MAG: ester cyclase [Pseudomonadota bacterium]